MTEINLTQNDKGMPIYFRVTDANGIAVNISTALGRVFKIGRPGYPLIFSGSCTMPSGGETNLCMTTVTGGSLSVAGSYDGELEITFDANTIITVPNIKVYVAGEL